MKISNLPPWVPGLAGVCIAALVLSPAMSRRAQAFGGVWSAPGQGVEQSAARILFVDNPDATLTAVIQIEVAGPSRDFAWVIPVPGKPVIALSSNTVFARLDAATAPAYWLEVATAGSCKHRAAAQAELDAGGAPSAPGSMPPDVVAIDQGTFGPYEYVNAKVDPSAADPVEAAIAWLGANGYDSTRLDRKRLGAYLSEGLNLLAFKLKPGMDVRAIRPVMLTYAGKRPAIPLRLAAAAAQSDMRIQVWVIGPSQAVPANYRSLVIDDARIDWLSAKTFGAGTLPSGGAGPFGDYVAKPSNYDAVVSAAADAAGGQGFVTELGGPASQYRDKLWSPMDEQQLATLSNQRFADGIDAIVAARALYGGWDGWREAIAGATTLQDGVTIDELARDPERYRGKVEVDSAGFLRSLEASVVEPVQRAAGLLYNAPYLTRLFTTMSADEMTLDPTFDYNAELAQVSNVHIARQYVECSPDREPLDAPWRIELPQGGVITGEGSDAWPADADSLPANLKIVQLSSRGSGDVVEDNSALLGAKLLDAADSSGDALLKPAQNGLTIGGTQSVTPPARAGVKHAARPPSTGGQCSVSRAGALSRAVLAPWLALALVILALRRHGSGRARGLVALLLLAGCESGGAAPAHSAADAGAAGASGALTAEQLRDPESCKGCHPIHYREWSSSMHAYAAKDPVFLAMNRRGQRETNGALGDFCIQCHAPMAVIDGRSKDGLDLPQLPDSDRGVSCYFCHSVTGVAGDHNALLHLAGDTTLRGPIQDPLDPVAHHAEYSETFEQTNPKSTAMCGGCHDIVMRSGVHLERTLQEYRNGIFANSATGDGDSQPFDSCVGCHMPGEQALAAVVPGAVERTVHQHLWPGIDVALTAFPHRDAMRSAVEDCQLGPASVSFFTLEVTPPDLFTFQLETNAGHNQPSGAAQDRRMWLEFSAYDARGRLLDAVSSGQIADDEIEERAHDDPKHDPHLVMFRDRIYDAQGKPVHMFWQAAKSDAHPDGYESNVLPVSTTTYIEGKHAVIKQYRASGPDGLPARVTARLRMRPIGRDVLQDLVDSGDLDPKVMAQMPTFTFGAQVEWTPEDGLMKTISALPQEADCSTYRCLLDPGSKECR